jgi:HK97 family phage portal protein
MSLLFRGQQQRDWTPAPPIPSNSQAGTTSLRSVNVGTTEGAMQKIAVASSVRLIASVMTSLPIDVYSGSGDTHRPIKTPTWMADLGGDGYGLEDWVWRAVYSWALRGNVLGTVVDRDSTTAKPRTIALHHPDDVTVSTSDGYDDGVPSWMFRGKPLPKDRVFHKRIFPIPGCIMGASPIRQHALTIAGGLSAEQFGAQFFVDGGHPTAIFQNKTKTLDSNKTAQIKERFMAALRGNREPIVLGADWDYKQIQISPSDSQFLDTGRYSSAECARIYGPGMPEILGYETGGSMTYANIEQRALDLLTFTLDPWLVRMERLLSELLPNPQYVKFERKALLRTDILTRFQAHQIALHNQFETVNEVREIEDMAPVDWGETPVESMKDPVPIVPVAPAPAPSGKK